MVFPLDFQVHGGELKISSFLIEEARCLSLLVDTIAHSCGDGKCISFPLLYYVDSLIQVPHCITWSDIFLGYFGQL